MQLSLISPSAECALHRASLHDPELVRLSTEIEAIEQANGLREDETFHLDDAPEDWTALNGQWNAHADGVIAGVLRDAGCGEVAEAMLRDRSSFEKLTNEGYAEIWGSDEE